MSNNTYKCPVLVKRVLGVSSGRDDDGRSRVELWSIRVTHWLVEVEMVETEGKAEDTMSRWKTEWGSTDQVH